MNQCPVQGCGETYNLHPQHVKYSPEIVIPDFCGWHNKFARDYAQTRGDRDQRYVTLEMIKGFPFVLLELNIVGQLRTGPKSYGEDRFNLLFVNGGAHGTINPTLRQDDPRGREYRDWIFSLPKFDIEFWRDRNTQHQELPVFRSLPVKAIGREKGRNCYRCTDSDGIDSLIRLDTHFLQPIAGELLALPERSRRETTKVAEFLQHADGNEQKTRQETLF